MKKTELITREQAEAAVCVFEDYLATQSIEDLKTFKSFKKFTKSNFNIPLFMNSINKQLLHKTAQKEIIKDNKKK